MSGLVADVALVLGWRLLLRRTEKRLEVGDVLVAQTVLDWGGTRVLLHMKEKRTIRERAIKGN